jgi:hypothetical protein
LSTFLPRHTTISLTAAARNSAPVSSVAGDEENRYSDFAVNVTQLEDTERLKTIYHVYVYNVQRLKVHSLMVRILRIKHRRKNSHEIIIKDFSVLFVNERLSLN